MNLLHLVIFQLSSAILVKCQSNKGCDADCMISFESALALEKASWAVANVSVDPFYDTPHNASGAKPGDLLRWEDLSSKQLAVNWTGIPQGMSISRILYMSEDVDRSPVPVSAFILLPYSASTLENPSGSIFRTLAWAHGTSGRSRWCAPSNYKGLYYDWGGPFFYAANGYAVIATDYAGQGTEIPGGFHYLAGHLHAADVAYSVIAARTVIGHLLSEEWVVVGHSEGGLASWRTNERLAMPDQEHLLLGAGKFLGAVSAAPALRPKDLLLKGLELVGDGPLGNVFAIYVLETLTGIYPELNIADYLTDTAISLLPFINQGCIVSGTTMFGNLTVAQVYKNTSWLNSPQLEDWQTRYVKVGPSKLAAPMMVIQGLSDTTIYANSTEWDFNLTCERFPESAAEIYLLPELGHRGAFQAAQPYYIAWVDRLFTGGKFNLGCKRTLLRPTNYRFQVGVN